MLKKLLLIAFISGSFMFLSQADVSAQVCTGGSTGNFVCSNDSNTMGSTLLGFDPTVKLMPAVVNTDPSMGSCFTCTNSNAGGTTAGALTNSMFGEIRDNNSADLGDKSFSPGAQGQTLPGASECGSNCNDSGAFTFSLPMPDQNFLGEGADVTGRAGNNPDGTPRMITGGRAGVSMSFNNDFTFNADGTSTFAQTVQQTTFVGGFGATDFQDVSFEAHSDNPAVASDGGFGGTIFWEQSINEGGFILGPLTGSFLYNGTGSIPNADAPTGPQQSSGDTSGSAGRIP